MTSPPSRARIARDLARVLVVWGTVVGVSTLIVLDFTAPDPAPADAPRDEFSAARAWEHLDEIAREPHPAASLENARVRGRLIDTLDTLGWDVRVALATLDDAPTVSNVLARLEGTCDTDDAVLLVTHYDSVPAGPGAGDVANSVAALLEVARALSEGTPVCNDVIVLLTDGEESGLLGARAFVADDPWADDVGFIVNFDARGGTGPLILGEWSDPSPELVREVTGELSRVPGTTSLVNEGPKRIDTHTTDFEIFHELGVPGVNGANVGDSVYYHTPADTTAVVSRATTQHNGETALTLARHFGDEDLGALPAEEDGVWVALTSGWLVAYGAGIAWLLAAAVVALVAALVVAARAHGVRWRFVAAGMAALPVAALGAFVLTTLLLAGVNTLHPGADLHLDAILPHNADLPDPEAYWWAFVAAGAAWSATVLTVGRRWLSAVETTLAGVLWIAGLGLLTTAVALPVSYVFVLPALGSSIGALVWIRGFAGRTASWGAVSVLVLSSLPALLVYVGFLRFSAPARLGLAAAFVPFVALLLVLLAPHLEVGARLRRWSVPGALAGVALMLGVVAAVTTDADPSATRPARVDDVTPTGVGPALEVAGPDVGTWTLHAVETERGDTCVLATVPGDPATGDVGWCPVPAEVAPVLDFQWGRTPSVEPSGAAGARAARYVPDAEPEGPSTAVLFGGVHHDGDAVVRVAVDGRTIETVTRPGVIPGVRSWAVELPAGAAMVEELVVVDTQGAELARSPGFSLGTDPEV